MSLVLLCCACVFCSSSRTLKGRSSWYLNCCVLLSSEYPRLVTGFDPVIQDSIVSRLYICRYYPVGYLSRGREMEWRFIGGLQGPDEIVFQVMGEVDIGV